MAVRLEAFLPWEKPGGEAPELVDPLDSREAARASLFGEAAVELAQGMGLEPHLGASWADVLQRARPAPAPAAILQAARLCSTGGRHALP